jgi:hypothetical protein
VVLVSNEALLTDALFVTVLFILTAIASIWVGGLSAVTLVLLLLTILERHARWKVRPKRRGHRGWKVRR